MSKIATRDSTCRQAVSFFRSIYWRSGFQSADFQDALHGQPNTLERIVWDSIVAGNDRRIRTAKGFFGAGQKAGIWNRHPPCDILVALDLGIWTFDPVISDQYALVE